MYPYCPEILFGFQNDIFEAPIHGRATIAPTDVRTKIDRTLYCHQANSRRRQVSHAKTVENSASIDAETEGLRNALLASISHDLRTPLTSIRGYAEAITDGATSDPAWAAGVILSESRRLERLVRDLLELARLQTRSFSFTPVRADLSQLAIEALEGTAPDAATAGVRLSSSCPAGVPALVDPDRMAQVLANLVENAMKYASSSVQVGTQVAQGVALVWVDDDGPGIAADDRPHVFERLYVAKREPRRKEIGSGLGLAIVHELVTAMGGTVTAEAVPTGGARMVVRLPLAA
jgi:two-component system sensor histidine kinase BaeS